MFERRINGALKRWKDKPDRKPLMMLGARQVGKTYALKRFGKECFENVVYVSLDEEEGVRSIFKSTKNPLQIVEQLALLSGETIVPQTTLLVLDEIQSCPEAIASLKYFCERTPEYAVACAGSLLGLAFGHQDFSFPVGKVDHVEMHPLTFSEFLEQKDRALYRYFTSVTAAEPLPQVFFDRLTLAFNAYRVAGGMPEAAMKMLDTDVAATDAVLSNILKDYAFDFVKHATPMLANRITHVWNALPSQLAKENRKFVYQLVRPGARAREYEDALLWLQNAGLIRKVSLCPTPQIPLKAYEDLSIFKIYCLDIGLLRRLAEVDANVYVDADGKMKEFKGALAENYILQSLTAQGINATRYWASGNKAEVEFVVQRGLDVIPIEVKSGASVNGRSLSEYTKRYAPPLRLRYSMLNLKRDNGLINIPLFLADRTEDILRGITNGEA